MSRLQPYKWYDNVNKQLFQNLCRRKLISCFNICVLSSNIKQQEFRENQNRCKLFINKENVYNYQSYKRPGQPKHTCALRMLLMQIEYCMLSNERTGISKYLRHVQLVSLWLHCKNVHFHNMLGLIITTCTCTYTASQPQVHSDKILYILVENNSHVFLPIYLHTMYSMYCDES